MKERENSRESSGKLVGEENNLKDDFSKVNSKNSDNSDEKLDSNEKGFGFLGESSENQMKNFESSGVSESKRAGSSGFQELTLSYLCDNSKDGVSGKTLLNSFEKMDCNGNSNYKGKGILVSEDHRDENNRWIERDFLCLNGNIVNSSKRDVEEIMDKDVENRDKKQKMETLNLSLALPDVSLSLAGSNRVQNGDPPIQNGDFPARLRSIARTRQSVEPSDNNTRTTYSNDFTAASMSYSCSHPFSHNASCSLTRNSTENYDYSVGSHRREDQIWNAGEGTNGSVHSRFRPIGDGSVALSSNGPGSFAFANQMASKDASKNSIYGAPSSDNHSFFPSELPARPRMDTQSGDSRERGSESFRGLEAVEAGRARKLSRPERILREIVSESISVMAQIIQDLPEETLSSTKEYLKGLILKPERKDELMGLQNRLDRRSDLTTEALSKAHKNQLDILVAIKMGLGSYLSSKINLPSSELVEIFLLERCRNINCKRMLPVEDCDCKICSTKRGFCSECMCPVCLNFDCAANTCSWVGCDVCSHWCHATCGIDKNLIRPGPSLKGPSGTTEMQFNCLGCSHASEMYGFVKDVFLSCARGWGLETLIKELDCVSKTFRASEDLKGKELHVKANDMLAKLQKMIISPADVCNSMFQFFSYTDNLSELPSHSVPVKDTKIQATLRNEPTPVLASSPVVVKPSGYGLSSSSGRKDFMPVDLYPNEVKVSRMREKIIEDEWSVKLPKKDGFDSLESIVRVKEAEARMFQNRADDARREAESFRRMIRLKCEKLEEEYSEKLAKLCLQETEQRRVEKLEKLKVLEDSHCNYYQMKMRMQADIAGLLKRMEKTKQQWV